MPQLSEETKEKIRKAADIGKTVFHWGFVPLVIYLGQ